MHSDETLHLVGAFKSIKELVVVVRLGSREEWRYAEHHCEEEHTKCENVGLGP